MTKQPLELLSALVIILLVDPVAVFSLLSISFFCVSKKRKEKSAPGSEQMYANADGDGENGSHLELGNTAPTLALAIHVTIARAALLRGTLCARAIGIADGSGDRHFDVMTLLFGCSSLRSIEVAHDFELGFGFFLF